MKKKLFALILFIVICICIMPFTSIANGTEGINDFEKNYDDGKIITDESEDLDDDIIYVYKPEDLFSESDCFYTSKSHYILMNDIEFKDYDCAMRSFDGILDGNGYTIKRNNIYSNTVSSSQSGDFLICINRGVIKNLNIEVDINYPIDDVNAYPTCDASFGAICRINSTSGVIENCHIYGNININSDFDRVGGICGINSGIIRNCGNNADMNISTYYIKNGEIKGKDKGVPCGAITARNFHEEAQIIQCYNNGNIQIDNGQNTGGICGGAGYSKSIGTITDCINSGNIIAEKYMDSSYNDISPSGICSSYDTKMVNCINYGTVRYGIIRSAGSSADITNCYYLDTASLDGYKNEGSSSYLYDIVPLSETDFTKESSFSELDFGNVWIMGEKHPELRLPSNNSTTEKPLETPDIKVSYRTHIQSFGWEYKKDDIDKWKSDGAMSGTSGKAKRLEGINIVVEPTTNGGDLDLGIQYTTHCQSYGWLPWSADGDMNGTEGEAKRLEAIMIKLTGEHAELYDVYYRVHAQSYGWLGWGKNGEPVGTAGYGKRLEGIQIVVVKRGESFDKNMGGISSKLDSPFEAKAGDSPIVNYPVTSNKNPVVPGADDVNVAYRTHVQSFGWQGWKYNGQMSGTSGLAKRLEGIEINLTNKDYEGGIAYCTHVQTYAWQGADLKNPTTWKQDGEMAGTSGEAKRLEAICITLTGEMADHYDIYYRVHAQSYGWLGWAKNGAPAGTEGCAKRLEGIQIVLVPKGEVAPANDYGGVVSENSRQYVKK